MAGILDVCVDECPVAVVDIETTGLHPHADRVVEISVVRWEPDREPELVLDTLVDPERTVAATEIHGITDDDVVGAPTFTQLAGSVADALAGAVLAAYNVYFDVRFLAAEFKRSRFTYLPPHLCLMYMRPMLDLGRKCSLGEACRELGIEHKDLHAAALDATAGAHLWALYQQTMQDLGIRTFEDLRNRKRYKFGESFEIDPLDPGICKGLCRADHLKPRSAAGPAADPAESRRIHVREYWGAVTAAVADLKITDEELAGLQAARARLNLSDEEIRAVHGRVFAGMLGDALADSLVTEEEWDGLRRLHQCLRELGWAPGM